MNARQNGISFAPFSRITKETMRSLNIFLCFRNRSSLMLDRGSKDTFIDNENFRKLLITSSLPHRGPHF